MILLTLDMNKNIDIKLTFRPLEASDLELRTKWQNNPNVGQNLGWQIRKGTTLEEGKEWFKGYVNDESDQRFIIEANGKPIGIVGLIDINPVDKNAMLYIVVGEDEYRGLGLGRRACEFIIDFGFNTLKLHKIYLEVNSYNKNAYNLYKKLGFVEEGCFREQIFHQGKYYDEIYMGLFHERN